MNRHIQRPEVLDTDSLQNSSVPLEGSLWGAENVLYLDQSDGYTDIHISMYKGICI